MFIDFHSKIYLGAKKRFSLLGIIITFTSLIMFLCIIFKIIISDFRISDLTAMMIPLLIIFVARNNRKVENEYTDTNAIMNFEHDSLKITYANVNGGRKLGFFSEESCICYDGIESIEYSNVLNCFRIVGKSYRIRKFSSPQKEYLLNDGESVEETYVYVLDEEVAKEVKMQLEKFVEITVKVME